MSEEVRKEDKSDNINAAEVEKSLLKLILRSSKEYQNKKSNK